MAAYSTLDLLDAETRKADDALLDAECDHYGDPSIVDDEDEQGLAARRALSARDPFAVLGEATGTSRPRSSLLTRKDPKRRPSSATSSRAKLQEEGTQKGNQTTHCAVNEAEIQELRDQLLQSRQELAHTHEEREELQVAFRRLDQEIANGYNLTERKEKELKIAELITKNQKLSQMLEKELKQQETLHVANADLRGKVQRLEQKTTLLNGVLTSLEIKHGALIEANSQLLASHNAAQQRLANQHDRIIGLESKLVNSSSSQGIDYEEKLRDWEVKCTELQRKLDAKSALLRADRDRIQALDRACETSLQENASLESEVAGVHDKMIKMDGVMKTLEAKLEASSSKSNGHSTPNRTYERVRQLEEEVLQKNRLIADLKDTLDTILSPNTVNLAGRGVKRRSAGLETGNSDTEHISSRIVYLAQRLRKMEESRDHKSRCLDVLVSMLPHLLQQLDAIQDKFHATNESNSILSSAVEQLQSGNQDENFRSEPAVALAREGYLLSGPYQPELLMGYNMSRALSEVAPPPPRKHAKFLPFQVRTRVNISDKTSDSKGQFVLAADGDDSNGVVFLNRSKINAFLHFVQGNAAKARCKHLLVQKIADLLSSQRDLMFQHSMESTFFKAAVAKAEAEVREQTRQLGDLRTELDRTHGAHDGAKNGPRGRVKLLLKLVEAATSTPRHRQSTFITQAEGSVTSDILIAKGGRPANPIFGQDTLDLSGCDLSDDDLEPFLLKLSVGAEHVSELDLSDNNIGDDGAATIGAFLETRPTGLRVVNLRDNWSITSEGVSRLRHALMQTTPRQRIDTDTSQNALVVSAADRGFDTTGRPTVLLTVYLPERARENLSAKQNPDEGAQQMIQRLESMGFGGSNLTRAEAVYRTTSAKATKPKTAATTRRVYTAKTSIASVRVNTRLDRPAQQLSQQEKKFRALEAALQRADVTVGTRQRGIRLSQMQYLLQHPNRSKSSSSTHTAPPTLSSQRMAKLRFAQSHLATIRGLGKK